MKMSEFLNMDMGELSDWIIENGHDYVAIKNYEHDRLTEENAKLREFAELVSTGDSASNEAKSIMVHTYIYNAKQLLNQLKEQNNDK